MVWYQKGPIAQTMATKPPPTSAVNKPVAHSSGDGFLITSIQGQAKNDWCHRQGLSSKPILLSHHMRVCMARSMISSTVGRDDTSGFPCTQHLALCLARDRTSMLGQFEHGGRSTFVAPRAERRKSTREPRSPPKRPLWSKARNNLFFRSLRLDRFLPSATAASCSPWIPLCTSQTSSGSSLIPCGSIRLRCSDIGPPLAPEVLWTPISVESTCCVTWTARSSLVLVCFGAPRSVFFDVKVLDLVCAIHLKLFGRS